MTESTLLILASSSPRRRQLLERLRLPFEVVVPDLDESTVPGEPPDLHVSRLAREKGLAVADGAPDRAVLAADTIVVIDGIVLGKPDGPDIARSMLRSLAGRTHEVLTGIHLCFDGREASHVEKVLVQFARCSDEIIDWYVATGEPFDKAGGYAIQGRGALLVERIDGNVQAVVGLPLAPLPAMFERVGLRLGRTADRLTLTRIR